MLRSAETKNAKWVPDEHQRWAISQLIFGEILEEFHGHFKRMGIRFMPIKGAYLIASGLAEKMHTRHMADIDILVEKENFEAVSDYFSKLDNVRMKHDEWYFEQPLYYRFAGQEHLVEIHYLLNRPERFRLPTKELFARGIRKSEVMWWPSVEDAALICVCHEVVHIAYQPFRKELVEEFSLLHAHPEFGWDVYLQRCRSAGVMRLNWFLMAHCRLLPPSQKSSWGIYVAWARFYDTIYPKLPFIGKRLLFEIPLVLQPWRLSCIWLCGAKLQRS